MKLILARHATPLSANLRDDEAVPSDADDCLSPAGEREAQALADVFAKRFGGDRLRLLSSTLPRAVQTGQAIEKAVAGSVMVLDPRLCERNFQFPFGTTVAGSRRHQELSHLHPAQKFPGGESRAEHRQRVSAWLAELQSSVQCGDERDVLAVSHGGTIEHLLMLLFGAPVEASAHVFVQCDPAHYHVIECIRTHDDRLVWVLQEINVSWSPSRRG